MSAHCTRCESVMQVTNIGDVYIEQEVLCHVCGRFNKERLCVLCSGGCFCEVNVPSVQFNAIFQFNLIALS